MIERRGYDLTDYSTDASTVKTALDAVYAKKTNLNKSQNIAFGTVGGTTRAFTVSLTGVTLTEGTVIALYNAIGSNVANATLNVNGLGAKPLYNQASAIPASRFPNKSVCLFVYNTTIVSAGCWQIIYSYGANSTYSKATTTPVADTSSGAVGTINKYALEDHSHPQSSLYAEASHSHTESQITDLGDYIETSAIANNLTTTSSGYVLDARQGKALADLIGDAIAYINQ